MSYNPVRHANFNTQNQKKQYVPKPGDGIRHSDIMRKAGVGVTLATTSARKPTAFGYHSEVFNGKDFNVRFEVLFPGNKTAYGANEKAERHIRVIRGSVYVTHEFGESEKAVTHLKVGGAFSAPRGTKYALATSGSEEVELLIVESPNYEKHWKQLEEPVLRGNGGVVEIPEAPVFTRNKDDSKEKEYALAQAQERNKRVPAKTEGRKVSDASATPGVNLRPGGPGAYGE